MVEAQLPLWGDRRKPLGVRYTEWRQSAEGHEVAHQVAELALTAAAAGRERISINLLFEQVRQARRFSIDNSFRAFLARELRDVHPELRERIHVRERQRAA